MLFMSLFITIYCVLKVKNVMYIIIKVKVDKACNLKNKDCRGKNESIKQIPFNKYVKLFIHNWLIDWYLH
jgi:hypothetical protein